jgi:hypothetical protein
MQLEFPYQIVTFLDKEPETNEPVYYGENGWYPQLALKRRFKLNQIDEASFVESLKEFSNQINNTDIVTGALVKLERIPVRVIDIANQDTVKQLHSRLIATSGEEIVSRYPDREGENYYAHITAEYNNEFVIPVDDYINKRFTLSNIWLLKDIGDENSRAYLKIK